MLMLVVSETDHVAVVRLLNIKAHPLGSDAMKASKCWVFAGGAAA
jgi:hypothetical protein